MNEREKILGRIREALKVSASLPGSHGETSAHTATGSPASHAREWLPSVGASTAEQFDLFAKNAADLKADFQLFNSAEEVRQALARLRDAEKWQRVATHSGGLTDAICPILSLPLLRTDRPYDVQNLEKCDAGISECDALIAQTGSVVVTNRSAGGRALSVLPPHHVVLARREQLLADLPAAFAMLQQKYAANYPSMISFITGPSRTGDIERILVLGAHGPKKLTIFCF
ncbi:MAG TPA: lactate utilization protein [Verrucomicrobiae bacterium]